MDNRAILLIGTIAICAFLGGVLVGGPGDEENEAATPPSPLPDEYEAPKAMMLAENDSGAEKEDENESLEGIFSDPNGVEPPSFPSP
jgi:hypothetical protein